MIEALTFWNEPNNLSHWDYELDPQWHDFSALVALAAAEVRARCPALTLVLGGISPIDPVFLQRLRLQGALDQLDAVAVHGFPLDWNHWPIDAWPQKIAEIQAITSLPVWVTEVGASSFGAEEVQRFGLQRTTELLLGQVERIFWYSLFDLPQAWGATTRHKESEGSSYYRHFYMGLIRPDGTPKLALEQLSPALGLVQWLHYEDPRLDDLVRWLRILGLRRLRTGISWADWHRPGALAWFDRQMAALAEFDLTVTLCFTPPSRGRRQCHTSPPLDLGEFAHFAIEVVERYVLPQRGQPLTLTPQPIQAGTLAAPLAPDA